MFLVCCICTRTFSRRGSRPTNPTCSPECRKIRKAQLSREREQYRAKRVGSRSYRRSCKGCGCSFMGLGRRRYCSEKCRPQRVVKPERDRNHSCERCGKTWIGNQHRFCSERCGRLLSRPRKGPFAFRCELCAEVLLTPQPNTRVCRPCRRRFEKQRYQAARRKRIFERDGWTCYLCTGVLARDRVWPHPESPSLDHVIPLAAGGANGSHNIRAAHWRCNQAKGTKLLDLAV